MRKKTLLIIYRIILALLIYLTIAIFTCEALSVNARKNPSSALKGEVTDNDEILIIRKCLTEFPDEYLILKRTSGPSFFVDSLNGINFCIQCRLKNMGTYNIPEKDLPEYTDRMLTYKEYIDISESELGFWKEFRERHPEYKGYIRFNKPVIFKWKNRAYLDISRHLGWKHARGYRIKLRKKRGQWEIIDKKHTWMS